MNPYVRVVLLLLMGVAVGCVVVRTSTDVGTTTSPRDSTSDSTNGRPR